MKKAILCFAAAVFAVAVAAAPAYAAPKNGGGDGGGGSPASNKAYFGINTTGVTFQDFDPTVDCGADNPYLDTSFLEPNQLCSKWMDIYDVPYALKTSTNGGVGVYVSLECALWTTSQASAMIGTSGSGGSRAGIEIRVLVNEAVAHPGNVVYCDRLQWIQLTIPEMTATVSFMSPTGTVTASGPVTSTEPFVLDMFQRTKSAHAFNFYHATGAAEVGVTVQARGIVQCSKDGMPAPCKEAGLDEVKFFGEDITAGTRAAIGKASFVIEEHNNWDSSLFIP